MHLPLTLIHSHVGYHHRALTAIAFSPDGALLASASRDSSLFLFEVQTGRLIAAVELDANHVPTVVLWRDSSSFWLASSDGLVTLWSISRRAGRQVSLLVIDALPYQFPAPPTLLRARNEPVDPKYIVVGFKCTFEVWGRGSRGAWSAHGHAKSLSGSKVLAAWPLSHNTILILFHHSSARIWMFEEDRLLDIVGWPADGLSEMADFLPGPASNRHDDHLSARIAGRIVLVDTSARAVHIHSLSLDPMPFISLVHTVSFAPDFSPTAGIVTVWSGSPIFIAAHDNNIHAFDLSSSAFQQAFALIPGANAARPVTMAELQTLQLQSSGRVAMIATFSGRLDRLIAAAHPASVGGWAVSVWSASDSSSFHDSLQPIVHSPPLKVRAYAALENFRLQRGRVRVRAGCICRVVAFFFAFVLLAAAMLAHESTLRDWARTKPGIARTQRWTRAVRFFTVPRV